MQRNSHTKISPARTSPAQIEAIKSKKTVSWAAGDKLVNARYFDVVSDSDCNVVFFFVLDRNLNNFLNIPFLFVHQRP